MQGKVKLTASFTLADWITLRVRLKDKGKLTEDWENAILIIKERVGERYFDPINSLINQSKNRGEGFTILTIECTLIEFLATLEQGRVYKAKHMRPNQSWYYTKSSKLYQQFLRSAPQLSTYFGHGGPFSPSDFYENVRCALVHESQTKNNWKVKVHKRSDSDKLKKSPFEILQDGTKVIYRSALFESLKSYFKDYVNDHVSASTEKGRTLRKHLARKIDQIAEITPDTAYWWI